MVNLETLYCPLPLTPTCLSNSCISMYVCFCRCPVYIVVLQITSDAYIYFYPVLRSMGFLDFSVWPHGFVYIPVNTVSKATELVDWTTFGNTDPSVDILYFQAWLDLEEPVVLSIEEFPILV